MKPIILVFAGWLFLAAPAAQAQFRYTTNADETITITGYSGPVGAVNIPTNLNGLTVTSIGADAFASNNSLTSVAIPGSVTSIGANAFESCSKLTNATIANGLTSLPTGVFRFCSSLNNVTIPGSITNLGDQAFANCSGLTSLFFQSNAPAATAPFVDDTNKIAVYYLPGTTGWSSEFFSLAVLWNPQIQTGGTNFGVRSNRFGFDVTGTTNIPIVVQTSASLSSPAWTPLTNVTLTNGLFYFSDAGWSNYPGRYYRISSP
jgi:hypothetical protein